MNKAKKSTTGEIITFYSYKGGTGRTMALANVACLLAQTAVDQERILMIDWDLEAPGLHQYFCGKFSDAKDKSENLPEGQLGLIDLFCEIMARLDKEILDDIPDNFFDTLNFEQYLIDLKIDSLMLLPAGRFDDGLYSSRVNAFDWDVFFNNYQSVFSQFVKYLRKKFKFVLIDSRTGYTDISGICTSLMPEKLVVVFTPNRQSLTGVVELVRDATDYRKQSDDLRPLIVFPLASRIENAERELHEEWRFGSQHTGAGYQHQFELVFTDIYKLLDCDLTTYFDEVQLQYVPRYAFGEEIAVLSESSDERLSLARSFETFTKNLVENDGPWKKSKKSDNGMLEKPRKTSTKKYDVFLSYSYTDIDEAKILGAFLRQKRLKVFLSGKALTVGNNWEAKVKQALVV